MNKGIHLDLDTWIVPGQILKANLCWGLGNSYKPAVTEVLISAVAHNPTAIQGGAECHNCEHPRLRCSMHCPVAYTHQHHLTPG